MLKGLFMTTTQRLLLPQSPLEGIPTPVVSHIASMFQEGRQVFGAAGASLTWGIDGSDGGDITAGIEGERMTAKLLLDWLPQYPNAYLAHSIQRPTSVGDTDHMLVMGRYIILIDSKRWKGKRKYSLTEKGTIKRGTVDFTEGNINIMPALQDWRRTLGENKRVSGVVTIAQEEVFVVYDKNWAKAPFKLVANEKLIEFLDRMASNIPAKDRDFIDVATASKIITRCLQPRDRRKEIINMKHLQ